MNVDKPNKEYLIKNIVVSAYQVESDIEIEVTQSRVLAKKGDWIVTSNNGKSRVVENQHFHNNYIVLDDHLGDKFCKDTDDE
jgi:hypothetical protein